MMKKITMLLIASLMLLMSGRTMILALELPIKDEFTFANPGDFNIVKDDEAAERKLAELKRTFDAIDGVELKLEKTGDEGIDVFMAYYTGTQAEALNDLYMNSDDPENEAYWNDLVDELRNVSRGIQRDVGDYYGVGMAINVEGSPELLVVVTNGNVMVDYVNPANYDADFVNSYN